MMCLGGGKRHWVKRQKHGVGLWEINGILMTGGFVCHEVTTVAAVGITAMMGFVQRQWAASRSLRKHVCIVYTIGLIGITK